MRSSGASAETSRAKSGADLSMSSIREMSVGRVVRGYRENARSIRPVAPRVAGAPLGGWVARPPVHLLRILNQHPLALEDQAEIQQAGFPRPAMRSTFL